MSVRTDTTSKLGPCCGGGVAAVQERSGMHSPFDTGLAISTVNTLREAPLRAPPFL
jgi:hypothetical protein